MDTQGLSEGSLRNSSHRESHAVRRKPAPASFQDLARKLVESCSDDLILRQRLDMDKLEGVLKRATFYAMANEGRAEPGFLVFMPGKPAIFLQNLRQRGLVGWTLRLRSSTYVAEGGGSVLIATLDDVLHQLRLEDVWMWRGRAVAKELPFSRRREFLKEFVERHWIPDARLLGGIFTKVAQPISLEELAAADGSGVHSYELIPEQAGRRRLHLFVEEQAKVRVGHAGLKQDRNVVVGKAGPAATVAVEAPKPVAPPQASRRARAVAVDKMPDIYDLYGEDGLPISRASVQQFSLSQQLRATKGDLWVQAAWRPEFGGYEIIRLA